VSYALDDQAAGALAARLDVAGQARLGRSLSVFPVHAGDCGGCALEFAMLRGVAYTLSQHGFSIAESPAAADILLVSGVMTRSLVLPVQLALAGMAQPRWVVAIGDCARDGGMFNGSAAVLGGVSTAIPVDLVVPGCPPPPGAILAGLRTILAANV